MSFQVRELGPSNGRPVLLLHGFPQTSVSWRLQLEALADAGHRAVAPDLRGLSPAARPKDIASYRIEELVSDVLAIADALGAERFDLVGHDWGAFIAWAVAYRHPRRLRTLTSVSSPHPAAFQAAYDDPRSDQRQRSAYLEILEKPGLAEAAFAADDAQQLRELLVRGGPEALEETLRVLRQPGALSGALSYYRAQRFGACAGPEPIDVPTLFVWGSEDLYLGPDAAERTRAYVAGPYRFEPLEGVSHWLPEEEPDQLNELLIEHLAAHA